MSFDLSFVFGMLYPIVPAIAFIGYCPQLYAAFKSADNLASISLLTWCIWLGSWGIAAGYSAITIQDPMLTFTAGLNIATHFLFIGTIIYKRRKYTENVLAARFKVDTGVYPYVNEIADQMHDKRYEGKEIQSAEHDRVIPIDDAFIAQKAEAIEAENNFYQQ